MKLKRWRGALVVCLLIGVITAVAVMTTGFSDANADDGVSEGVPRIYISLNGVTLEEINDGDKDVKYEGNKLVLWDGDAESYFEDVEIKGRGNSTWNDEKKPYRIRFNDKINLLDMGKSRKWALLSYNTDASLLRGDLGFYLAGLVDPEYPLSGRFVELLVDDNALGLYYITETVNIGKDAVDLRDPFGIVVELDNAFFGEEEQYYETQSLDHLTIKDVVSDDNAVVAFSDFVKGFEELEKAAEDRDIDMVCTVADITSLAQYYVFSEFIGNFDAYVTSFYFYKDGFEDVIHAGPAWDFDGTFGNTGWSRDEISLEEYAPERLDTRRHQAFGYSIVDNNGNMTYIGPNADISKLMYNLYDIPEFRTLVEQIYAKTISKRRNEIMEHIRETADQIRSVAILNNEIWRKGDFDEAVRYLLNWVDRRFDVFDRIYLPDITERIINI